MLLRICSAATLSLLDFDAGRAPRRRCEEALRKIGKDLADVTCFESTDLTTNNPQTTPANNSMPGLPAFAFTPMTDRGVISPSAAKRPPITKVVPGVQIQARIAADPTGQARFLLRLPDDWNGRLVVAGASGTRSEFNGDFAWSDYVVQKGYAYASQNKGVLNLAFAPRRRSAGLPAQPASPMYVHFYDNDAGQPFTRWAEYMVDGGRDRAGGRQVGATANCRSTPMRWARPTAATRCAARSRRRPSCSTAESIGKARSSTRRRPTCSPTCRRRSSISRTTWLRASTPNSTAAKNIVAAGYPPDIVRRRPRRSGATIRTRSGR